MTQTNDVQEQITRTHHKMLDALERIVDQLAPPPPRLGTPPPDVRRRQIANIMRLSNFCARSQCRRSGCCRGEPLHCLQIAIPLLPPGAFAGIVTPRQRQRRRR